MLQSGKLCKHCQTALVDGASYCHHCGTWVAMATGDSAIDVHRLFNYAVDLMCIAGTDGYFKAVNPAFERALGYSADELLARPFVEFTHPEDRDVTRAETHSLATGQPTLSFTNRYRAKDGTWVRLEWTAFPEPGSNLIYATARATRLP